MRAMCAAVLSFEAVVLGLSAPVMITVSGVERGVGLAVGLGLAAFAIVAAALLRHPWAYWLGHLVQVAAISLGVVVSAMYVLGAIFAVLWVAAIALGRRVEEVKARAARSVGP